MTGDDDIPAWRETIAEARRRQLQWYAPAIRAALSRWANTSRICPAPGARDFWGSDLDAMTNEIIGAMAKGWP